MSCPGFRFGAYSTEDLKPHLADLLQGTLCGVTGRLRGAGDIAVRAMESLRDYTKGIGSRCTDKYGLWAQLFHRTPVGATSNRRSSAP